MKCAYTAEQKSAEGTGHASFAERYGTMGRKAKPKTELATLIAEGCARKGITKNELCKRIGMAKGAINYYCNVVDTPPKPELARKIEKELDLEPGTVERSALTQMQKEPQGVRYASPTELKILAAWHRGDRTPEEVQKITGCSMQVIGRYLPLRNEA